MESEQTRWDTLAKGVADGTVSRRRALRLGATAVLGGIVATLGLGTGTATARRRRRCRPCQGETSCGSSNCGVPPNGSSAPFCSCVKSTSGKKCCVALDCTAHRCSVNSDCASNEICSKEARRFCCASLQGRRGICARKCVAA